MTEPLYVSRCTMRKLGSLHRRANLVHRDGISVLTAVRLRHRLRIPAGPRERVDRALARHQDKYPTAVTLKPAVRITWEAEVEEIG